ncbi:HEAT repeat domain-containing protein [Pyxidicoccus xibeiensis]|uniref:HEAT repeat domain-containing protein n=1 Tax=Pyxidicoccus xibeiensis TaxID=2906759 RepID=UPI0020A72706|nr:HEAT repeat domain-containing protein [Pyxidicoccus xibeiensis]MCP3144968.1 HEAT repeat domain-containing protein [Pyxidicoccus xibeiensis]
MRPLLLPGLLLAGVVHAQAPAAPARPAPRPGPARKQPARATPAPAPTQESAAAPTAPPLPTGAPGTAEAPGAAGEDTALLRALLWAVKPAPEEIRAIAIEDVGLLGDARALDMLAALMWDPNPRIQQAALRAVALFQHPRAEEILGNVVRHPRMPDALKIQALNGLIFQRTATAQRTVRDAATDSRLTAGVQNAARTVATQWEPTPAPR